MSHGSQFKRHKQRSIVSARPNRDCGAAFYLLTWANPSTGALAGVVLDPSGAELPGVVLRPELSGNKSYRIGYLRRTRKVQFSVLAPWHVSTSGK